MGWLCGDLCSLSEEGPGAKASPGRQQWGKDNNAIWAADRQYAYEGLRKAISLQRARGHVIGLRRLQTGKRLTKGCGQVIGLRRTADR